MKIEATNKKINEEISINDQLRHLYLNKNIQGARDLIEKEEQNIDFGKDNSFIEFAALCHNWKNKNQEIEELDFLISIAEKTNQVDKIKPSVVHNILLTAIYYNNWKLIDWCTKKQKICTIHLEYENYSLLRQCFSKNGNPKKLEILLYFIQELGIKKNKEIIRILKKMKKTKYLKYFDAIESYQNLIEKLPSNNRIKNTKIKV